jgi:hypothetical protein
MKTSERAKAGKQRALQGERAKVEILNSILLFLSSLLFYFIVRLLSFFVLRMRALPLFSVFAPVGKLYSLTVFVLLALTAITVFQEPTGTANGNERKPGCGETVEKCKSARVQLSKVFASGRESPGIASSISECNTLELIDAHH